MKTIYAFYLAVLVALVPCCHQKQNDLPCIDVKKSYPEKEIFLTDIAAITYLHLNTDDDQFLYGGTIQIITSNAVVVLDRDTGNILFFNRDGTPKTSFNRLGNGPGEYGRPYRVFYDENKDDIFVFTFNNTILVYSSSGEYKREITLPPGIIVDGNSIVSLDEHSLFFYDVSKAVERSMAYLENMPVNDDYISSFYRISKVDGAILDYIELPISPIFLGIYYDGRRIPTRYNNRLIRSIEGVLLCNPENDTVFLYGQDRSITPVIYQTPSISSLSPIKYINNCVDMGRYQFMQVVTGSPGDDFPGNFPVAYYVRDKHTGEIFRQKLILPDYKGKEFIIGPSGRVSGYEEGVLFELDLLELKQAYSENRLSGKLKELVGTLKEDDNNVYVMVDFM